MPLCPRPIPAPRPTRTVSATSKRVLRFGDDATTFRSRGLSAHHRSTAGAEDAEAALAIYGIPDVTGWLTPATARIGDLPAMRAVLHAWVESGPTVEMAGRTDETRARRF